MQFKGTYIFSLIFLPGTLLFYFDEITTGFDDIYKIGYIKLKKKVVLLLFFYLCFFCMAIIFKFLCFYCIFSHHSIIVIWSISD